jgi:hypothetical protein
MVWSVIGGVVERAQPLDERTDTRGGEVFADGDNPLDVCMTEAAGQFM